MHVEGTKFGVKGAEEQKKKTLKFLKQASAVLKHLTLRIRTSTSGRVFSAHT